MSKRTHSALIVVLLGILFAGLIILKAFLCGIEAYADAEIQEYPAFGKITEVFPDEDFAIVMTTHCHLYVYREFEDLECGDFLAMIMTDNGTPYDLCDDQIVCVRYVGFSIMREAAEFYESFIG